MKKEKNQLWASGHCEWIKFCQYFFDRRNKVFFGSTPLYQLCYVNLIGTAFLDVYSDSLASHCKRSEKKKQNYDSCVFVLGFILCHFKTLRQQNINGAGMHLKGHKVDRFWFPCPSQTRKNPLLKALIGEIGNADELNCVVSWLCEIGLFEKKMGSNFEGRTDFPGFRSSYVNHYTPTQLLYDMYDQNVLDLQDDLKSKDRNCVFGDVYSAEILAKRAARIAMNSGKKDVEVSMADLPQVDEQVVNALVTSYNNMNKKHKFALKVRDIKKVDKLALEMLLKQAGKNIDLDDLKEGDEIPLADKLIEYKVVDRTKSGDLYGRLHAPIQNMSSELRKWITIDGSPVEELDLSAHHPSLLFAHVGKALSANFYDCSVVDFSDSVAARKVLKNLALRFVQSKSASDCKRALKWSLNTSQMNQDLLDAYEIVSKDIDIMQLFDLYLANECAPIAHLLFGGYEEETGHSLFVKESDMLKAAIELAVAKDIPVISVHDSYCYPVEFSQDMQDIIYQVSKNEAGMNSVAVKVVSFEKEEKKILKDVSIVINPLIIDQQKLVIYAIKNSINQKVYIGQTVNLKARWKNHLSAALGTSQNTKLYFAMRKHGVSNFYIEVIDTAKNRKQLDLKEKAWIKKYDSFNNGYNGDTGGHREGKSGATMSDEQRLKISKAAKERYYKRTSSLIGGLQDEDVSFCDQEAIF